MTYTQTGLEALEEQIAKIIHDEDDACDTCWPEGPEDTGQRTDDGYVRLPSEQEQETIRHTARQIIAVLPAAQAALTAPAEPVAWQYSFEPDMPWHTVDFRDQIPKKSNWPRLQIRPVFASSPADAARIAELEAEKRELLDVLAPLRDYSDEVPYEQGENDDTVVIGLSELRASAALHAKLKGDA